MAARRIYDYAEAIMNAINSKRNDIAKEMAAFDSAYDKFINFWTDYYAHGTVGSEVDEETETLFNNIMTWSQLPVQWNIGDPQRIEVDSEAAITIKTNEGKIYYLRNAVLDEEVVESKESWCITKYDVKEHKQVCVEENMDKASAMMVAKRLSAEDDENFYTACQVLDMVKKETVVIPVKSYRKNNVIGKVTKIVK